MVAAPSYLYAQPRGIGEQRSPGLFKAKVTRNNDLFVHANDGDGLSTLMARVTPPGDSLFAASLLFFLLPLCALESTVAERLPLFGAVNAVQPDALAFPAV